MTDTSLESLQPKNRFSLRERLRRNPVVLKELRGRMRGRRSFIILTVYLALMALVVSGVYIIYMSSSANTLSSAQDRQIFGKTIFGVVVWLELMTVSFVAPALTAGAISSERERQTYDLLRTTLLSARSLVLGKFFSGLAFLLLLLFAALPLQSLAFLFGGVAADELWIGTALLVVTAVAFCAAGVFFSSLVKRTLISTVLAYAFAILLVFGIPMFFLLVFSLLSASLNGPGSPQISPATETALFFTGWLLVSTNPMATMVAAEAVLLQNQSPYKFTLPLSSGNSITLLSPWIPYIILYLVISVLLLFLAVRFVKRPER